MMDRFLCSQDKSKLLGTQTQFFCTCFDVLSMIITCVPLTQTIGGIEIHLCVRPLKVFHERPTHSTHSQNCLHFEDKALLFLSCKLLLAGFNALAKCYFTKLLILYTITRLKSLNSRNDTVLWVLRVCQL